MLRNPYSLKSWYFYLEFKEDAPSKIRNVIYERALQKLPGSYKLWFKYLMERKDRVKHLCISHSAYEETNRAFERALVFMHKYPRIWLEYLEFLMLQRKITNTRRTFDRALRSLPITQHKKIWPLYLEFAGAVPVPETAIRIFRRYLTIEPTHVETFIKYLKKVGRLDEAAKYLADIVNDERFESQRGKSKHDLWNEFLRLITRNPDKITSLNVDAIVRAGIKRYPHEGGKLWTALADYYIRSGHFEKARDVFEEALVDVMVVRDFTIVFDAYAQYEESMLTTKMAELEEEEEDEDGGADSDNGKGGKGGAGIGDDDEFDIDADTEIDLRIARLDDLTRRRPFMLNEVLLRQNPHNVTEWLNRVKLYEGQVEEQLRVYSEAVTTMDPQKATGKAQALWISFAKFYAKHGGMENARTVFEKATQVNYRTVDDLAAVWCQWAELEIKYKNYKEALNVMRTAARVPHKPVRWTKWDDLPVQERLHKSTKLWSFYADLEENLGTLESTKAVYESMFDLKIVTPKIVLNFASMLQERKFFEESFRVYEKGIALFEFPHVYPIWSAYLKKFTGRFKGKKLERARDLFEQAVASASGDELKKLYILYAKYEEEHGLARRAMGVYDRAVDALDLSERLEMYNIYVTKATQLFGLTKTREIYQKAIMNLPEAHLKDLCIKYAAMERNLGEVDRARAIYQYVSEFCNPTTAPDFWNVWEQFEQDHGNKDTYSDMLRVRRTVSGVFAASTAFQAPGTAAPGSVHAATGMVKGSTIIAGDKRAPENDMEQLEAQALEAQKEAGVGSGAASSTGAGAVVAASNPEEIDLDDDDSDDDSDNDDAAANPNTSGDMDIEITQKAIPDAVFGAAVEAAPKGAMERLQAKK